MVEAFTAELGPNVTLDSYSSNEELIAKLVAAKGTSGYDIVVPTGVFIPQMIENGLLQKFNKDLLPNISNMDPAYLGRAWDPSNEYSICKAWGTTGFVYDKTVITRELDHVGGLLRRRAERGERQDLACSDDPAGIIGSYFWANDMDWNTEDPAELEACREFLVNEIAPHISAFDSYPGTTRSCRARRCSCRPGTARRASASSRAASPTAGSGCSPGPITELWMDNWAIADGRPAPRGRARVHQLLAVAGEPALNLDYIGYNVGGKDMEEAAVDAGLECPS